MCIGLGAFQLFGGHVLEGALIEGQVTTKEAATCRQTERSIPARLSADIRESRFEVVLRFPIATVQHVVDRHVEIEAAANVARDSQVECAISAR